MTDSSATSFTPNTWLEQHAPGFDQLSENERAAIKDFSLLWSLFEALLLDTYGSATAIIKACSKLNATADLTLDDIAPDIDYFRKRYFDGSRLTPMYTGLHLQKNDHPGLVERFLTNELNDSTDVLSAVIIIVYRLRNNLFHGRKWSYGIKDQMENFLHANNVLMRVMER